MKYPGNKTAENNATWKFRGRNRIFLRHCNPFKFPEARRNKMPKFGKSNPFMLLFLAMAVNLTTRP